MNYVSFNEKGFGFSRAIRILLALNNKKLLHGNNDYVANENIQFKTTTKHLYNLYCPFE